MYLDWRILRRLTEHTYCVPYKLLLNFSLLGLKKLFKSLKCICIKPTETLFVLHADFDFRYIYFFFSGVNGVILVNRPQRSWTSISIHISQTLTRARRPKKSWPSSAESLCLRYELLYQIYFLYLIGLLSFERLRGAWLSVHYGSVRSSETDQFHFGSEILTGVQLVWQQEDSL